MTECRFTRRMGIMWAAAGAVVGVLCLAVFFLLTGRTPEPRYIFVDGGAHLGETVQKFENTSAYLLHPWQIFAFEPNPDLTDRIPSRPHLTVLEKAIWTETTNIDFYLGRSTLGSSAMAEKKTGMLSNVPVSVEAVDFGEWLKQNFRVDDFVWVKLDIEGAEYPVLRKMLTDGSTQYVDLLFVEFHNLKVGINREEDIKIVQQLQQKGVSVNTGDSVTAGDWFGPERGTDS